jgi:hypothetical protein
MLTATVGVVAPLFPDPPLLVSPLPIADNDTVAVMLAAAIKANTTGFIVPPGDCYIMQIIRNANNLQNIPRFRRYGKYGATGWLIGIIFIVRFRHHGV